MNEMWLDPERAAGAGRDLAESGDRIADLRARDGSEVAALSGARPWGNDAIGQAFERNYRPVEEQLLQAWDLLGRHVTGLGEEVVQAVRDALEADASASAAVRRTYGHRS